MPTDSHQGSDAPPGEKACTFTFNLRHARHEAEINAIINALETTHNQKSAAAKLLGITRPTLYDLMKKHHIRILDQ